MKIKYIKIYKATKTELTDKSVALNMHIRKDIKSII